MMTTLAKLGAAALFVGILTAGPAQAGPTLDGIRQKGFVQCGVHTGLPGFASPGSSGAWTGLDVEYCRAYATAVFGDPGKVRFSPLSAQQRFTALQSGEIDVLVRNTTASLSRDTALGFDFAPPNFYDGQGFMISKSLNIASAKQLAGATVCVQTGTTTELNLADYFRSNNMPFTPVVIESQDEVVSAYFAGRCDLYTTDTSGLAGVRASLAPKPEDHLILPEVISKEPLAPAVRQGDPQWKDIVTWVHYALVEAEEKGITKANIDEMAKSKDPTIQRLVGTAGDLGPMLGLDAKWAYAVVKALGNYGEIFERNVGAGSPLGLKRGLNELWSKGGLQYAQPLR